MENAENPKKSRRKKQIYMENTQKTLERFMKMGEGECFCHSIPKDHQTDFELWDQVFFLKDNKVEDGKICEINITIKPNPHASHPFVIVKYKINQETEISSKTYQNSSIELDQELCFKSKEDLLKSL